MTISTRTGAWTLQAYGVSDTGCVRQNNEDDWVVLERTFILADGMGGHVAGEVAAKEAVCFLADYLQTFMEHAERISLEEAFLVVKRGFQDVNTHVYEMGRRHQRFSGMGTTLCCVHIHPEGVVYGHVGDSRIYRFRSNRLELLTHDHSLVREMVEMGRIDEIQAADFLYKNIITRAIGAGKNVAPTVRVDSLEPDDLFLLCSDGLSDLLKKSEIEAILQQPGTLQELSSMLIGLANARGGYDNITVILVRAQDASHLPRL